MKTCTHTSCKIFAVRFGETVEFRIAARQPKRIVSKLIKSIVVPESVYTTIKKYPYGKYITKPVTKKLVRKQVFFDGGRVIGICKLSEFAAKAKRFKVGALHKDSILKISPALKDACLEILW